MDKKELNTRAMWMVHDIVAAKPEEREAIGVVALSGLTEAEKDFVIGSAMSKMASFFDGIRSVPAFDAELDITMLGLALDLGPRPYEHPREMETNDGR